MQALLEMGTCHEHTYINCRIPQRASHKATLNRALLDTPRTMCAKLLSHELHVLYHNIRVPETWGAMTLKEEPTSSRLARRTSCSCTAACAAAQALR